MTSQSETSSFRLRVLSGRAQNRRPNPADELFSRGVYEHQGHPTFGITAIPGTARAKTHPIIWLMVITALAALIAYGYFVYTNLPG